MPLKAVLVVADGISGGYGSVASRAAVNTIRRVITAEYSPLCSGKIPAPEDLLAEALQQSDDVIREEAAASTEPGLMGTTCVAALVLEEDVVVASIGDSRVYLFRDGKLNQLTVDQTRQSDGKLANWLGGMREPPSTGRFSPKPGDRLLLCSDGLCGSVGETRIATVLGECENAADAVAVLLNKAEQFGSEDDATAAVASFDELIGPTEDQEPAKIAEPSSGQLPALNRMLVANPIGWAALGLSLVNSALVAWILFRLFCK